MALLVEFVELFFLFFCNLKQKKTPVLDLLQRTGVDS